MKRIHYYILILLLCSAALGTIITDKPIVTDRIKRDSSALHFLPEINVGDVNIEGTLTLDGLALDGPTPSRIAWIDANSEVNSVPELYWDDTNDLLGIGAASTGALLYLYGGYMDIVLTGKDGLGGSAALQTLSDAKTIGDSLDWNFNLTNSADASANYAKFVIGITDPTAGAMKGYFGFHTVGAADGIAERMRINDLGYVGINTPSPAAVLDVNGPVLGQTFNTVYLWGETLYTNYAFGDVNTLESLTTGNYNVAIGPLAGSALTEGSANMLIGMGAGMSLTTGLGNVVVGENALYTGITSTSCMAIGQGSMYNTTSSYNVGVGQDSLSNLVSGAYNVAIGDEAGKGKTTGTHSFAENVCIGRRAGWDLDTGYSNVFIGYNVGYVCEAGVENVCIGADACSDLTGSSNVCIGFDAGDNLTGGSNVFIGKEAGYRQTTNSNLLIIDNQDRSSAANEITNALIYGVFNAAPASQTLRINAVTTIGDGSLLLTSAAPSTDAMIVNKKYVDDQIAGVGAHAAVTVTDSQSINLTLSTQNITADVNDKDYGDVTVSGTGATWAVDNDSHDHSAAGSTVTIAVADITDDNAGTDITADLEEEAHASEHAVSGGDTVFPADPGADRYLMWDDDPGALSWVTIAAGGDMTKAVYDVSDDGFVDGNDVAYAAAWNGDVNAPSMNAVYDKMEAQTHTTSTISGLDVSDDLNLTAGDHITLTDDDLDIDDDFLHNTGDAGTGVYDFGAADSLEIPNGANPTTDADGEMAYDSDDEGIEVYDGSASRIIPTTRFFSATIIQPADVQANIDDILILPVEAYWAPGGIKLLHVGIKTNASSTYSVGFEERTTPTDGSPSAIETVATSASLEAEDDGALTDSDIAAGSLIYVDLPTTDANSVTVWATYFIKDFN